MTDSHSLRFLVFFLFFSFRSSFEATLLKGGVTSSFLHNPYNSACKDNFPLCYLPLTSPKINGYHYLSFFRVILLIKEQNQKYWRAGRGTGVTQGYRKSPAILSYFLNFKKLVPAYQLPSSSWSRVGLFSELGQSQPPPTFICKASGLCAGDAAVNKPLSGPLEKLKSEGTLSLSIGETVKFLL